MDLDLKTFDLGKEVPRLGQRAEIVASWYLRFNGYFPLTAFILHDAGATKQPGGQLTDADILAIRLPHTQEIIRGSQGDIEVTTDCQLDVRQGLTDFVIADVSSQECKFNWIDKSSQTVNTDFLEYCLRRFGYWSPDAVPEISKKLSTDQAFADDPNQVRVRLLSFGVKPSAGFPHIQQITFESVFEYMKLPLFGSYGDTIVSDHKQWHPLICEIYRRLRGHKVEESSPGEVVTWLFPGAGEAGSDGVVPGQIGA